MRQPLPPGSPMAPRLHPVSLRFLDAGLETTYREACGPTPGGALWLVQVTVASCALSLLLGDAELRQSSLMTTAMGANAMLTRASAKQRVLIERRYEAEGG